MGDEGCGKAVLVGLCASEEDTVSKTEDAKGNGDEITANQRDDDGHNSGKALGEAVNCRAYSVLLFVLKFPIDCDIIISSINLFLLVNRGNYE